jgi:O-antigen ligase
MTGVVLSLNRNMLLGLAFGLSVATIAARQRHRVAVMAAGLAMALCVAVLLTEGSAVGQNAVVSRVASITNYSELRTQTLDDRYYENAKAIAQLHAHPIGGLGWGPPYGAVLASSDDGFLVTRDRTFMHEQYLWIWMRAGFIGLLALLTMLAFAVCTGIRWLRGRSETGDAWLGAGVIVSVVALAASSNVAIYLTPPDSTVPLVGVLALAAVMRRDLGAARRPTA